VAACEMCGKEDEIVTALVEGVQLNVCQNCSSFGKIIKKPISVKKMPDVKKIPLQEREIIQSIREEYSSLIKGKREKMGLKQKEFAKFLSEKESMIHKIESGLYVPSLALARKIEKQLGISLVEEREVLPQHMKTKKETFTIGDIIKVR